MLHSKTRVSKLEGVGLEHFFGCIYYFNRWKGQQKLRDGQWRGGRDKGKGLRKAFIVCRVIAGRVHKLMMENFAEDEFEEEIRI